MNASEFKKLVNKTFATNIRQLGWKGSGFHFYRADPNHIVNIFGLQVGWTGGAVCCETAVHFDFIPDLGHSDVDVSRTTYASCIIRQRLSPKGDGDYSWAFSDREEENLRSIHQIWDSFRTHGLRFYSEFEDFPAPFDSIKPSDIETSKNYRLLGKYYIMNHIELVWLLKEVNLFIGRNPTAKEFADLGLRMALDHAGTMARQFKGKRAQDDIQHYRDIYKRKFDTKGY
jgi:hypothetical protein